MEIISWLDAAQALLSAQCVWLMVKRRLTDDRWLVTAVASFTVLSIANLGLTLAHGQGLLIVFFAPLFAMFLAASVMVAADRRPSGSKLAMWIGAACIVLLGGHPEFPASTIVFAGVQVGTLAYCLVTSLTGKPRREQTDLRAHAILRALWVAYLFMWLFTWTAALRLEASLIDSVTTVGVCLALLWTNASMIYGEPLPDEHGRARTGEELREIEGVLMPVNRERVQP